MCFSATASFTMSGVLAVAGALTLASIKSKRLILLALIPWIFAIQQVAEGIVWISLPQPSFAKNVFLFFAYVFWPTWIPLSLWLAEKGSTRKQILAVCLGAGIALSTFLLLLIPETSATVYRGSISYLRNLREAPFDPFALFFYAAATVLPLFVSSLKKVWIFGLLITLSGIATYGIDRYFFVSVWCFFAAGLSIFLFFFLREAR